MNFGALQTQALCFKIRTSLSFILSFIHPENGLKAGLIVETEAYGPSIEGGKDNDLVLDSHGARAKVLFGPPGHTYVFLVYGFFFFHHYPRDSFFLKV
jgi:hypothetical protein